MIAVLLIPVLVLLAGQVEAGSTSAQGKSWDVVLHDCKIWEDRTGEMKLQCKELECAERMKQAMTEMQWWLESEPKLTPYFKAKFRDVSDQVKSDWNATMKECVK